MLGVAIAPFRVMVKRNANVRDRPFKNAVKKIKDLAL
jgi:hypothetical protein